MANLVGQGPIAAHANTDTIDTTQAVPLGTRIRDNAGGEYIYLKGVASTTAGSWVTFDENFATTLLAANAAGPVAIAMAATDATTEFGWYQIFGKNTVAKTDTVAADAALYIDGTAGRVDDLGVAGDWVSGAVSSTADTANVATVFICYPFVYNNGYLV